MVFATWSIDPTATSRLLSGFAVGITAVAPVVLLSPRPLADAFFASWVLFGVGIALLGAVGAWTPRPPFSGWRSSC